MLVVQGREELVYHQVAQPILPVEQEVERAVERVAHEVLIQPPLPMHEVLELPAVQPIEVDYEAMWKAEQARRVRVKQPDEECRFRKSMAVTVLIDVATVIAFFAVLFIFNPPLAILLGLGAAGFVLSMLFSALAIKYYVPSQTPKEPEYGEEGSFQIFHQEQAVGAHVEGVDIERPEGVLPVIQHKLPVRKEGAVL